MERELKGMERTILISNDIRPFNFQAVKTAITSLQILLTSKKVEQRENFPSNPFNFQKS